MKPKLIFFLVFLFLFLGLVSAGIYQESNPRYTNARSGSSFQTSEGNVFDSPQCKEGSDFIIQIAPQGCEPSVVRSDLLEEQDVPVFCKLEAMKINPLLDVEAIRSINVAPEDTPPEVSGVGFHPSYSALQESDYLNNLQLGEIGYAVIFLKGGIQESELKNCENSTFGGEVCWVEGNLTARLRYDLDNAFGIRDHNFYLPVMDDSEFSSKMGQYSFFNKRGYLRAEDVGEDFASIGIYSGLYSNSLFGNSDSRQKIGGIKLNKGEESSEFLLPGFNCLAGVKFRLDDIGFADTIARLSINSEIYEVKRGESFLDNKCTVKKISKQGLQEIVEIKCDQDDSGFLDGRIFSLRISPLIKLNVSGEVKDYQLGAYLFTDNKGKNYYLGYVGDKNPLSNSPKDLEVMVVAYPGEKKDKLGEDELAFVARLYNSYDFGNPDNKNFLGLLKFVSASFQNAYSYIIKSKSYGIIDFEEKVEFGDSSEEYVRLLGFGGQENFELSGKMKDYYEKAKKDYDLVLSDFSTDRYPKDDKLTTAERSLYAKIKLAESLNQKNDLKRFCSDFEKKFNSEYSSNSYSLDLSVCKDLVKLSNPEISTQNILVDGRIREISFEGVYEPDFEDYGVEVLVQDLKGSMVGSFDLSKGDSISLDENNNFQFSGILSESKASFKFNLENVDYLRRGTDFFTSNSGTLKLNEPTSLGNYLFTLKKINSRRVAEVSVIPSIKNQDSEVDFGFKIGVEKRAIQLSPEKTKQMIEGIDNFMGTWNRLSDGLGTVVEGMKKACFGVGTLLTAKNLLFGVSGESIARGEVMRGEGGWYEKCTKLVSLGQYSSQQECLLDKSDKIDKEVDLILEEMTNQNERIGKIQDLPGVVNEGGFLGEDVVDQSKLVEKYLPSVSESINCLGGEITESISGREESIDLGEIHSALNLKGFQQGIYNLEELKRIELYSNLYCNNKDNPAFKKRLFTSLKGLETNSKEFVNANKAIENLGSKIGSVDEISYFSSSEDLEEIQINSKIRFGQYTEFKFNDSKEKISPESFVKPVIDKATSKNYLLVYALEDEEGIVQKTYLIGEDKTLYLQKEKNPLKISFKIYDGKNFKNRYKGSEFVKYYETEPYKGLPSFVVVDPDEGWYAHVEQTIPAFGEIASYNAARVNSFWLCNVGDNGLAEYSSGNIADDECILINLGTGQPYNRVFGLDDSESSELIENAIKAIKDASSQYKKSSGGMVKILGKEVKVGSPAIDNMDLQCTDVMSPSECQLLFNACDPVICPRSRCDFGGEFPVQDVVQSGIAGSLALCLPNWNEGIYLPVCLTGVKAGMDGYSSVMESYRDCLNTSLQKGETVGICDELHSIYMCEFFWKQALPLTQAAIPKIVGMFTGENVRGGGEYSMFSAAWENSKNSVNFFTQFYAANAFEAFRARSTEQVGTEVCKNFLSISYPNKQGFFDVLTEADSPPQFYGKFESSLFSSATVPPTNHYKVYYHIYSGNDRGAYYSVYLKSDDSSFYKDIGSVYTVDSGYIAAGKYVSNTEDFTYPAGYKKMCIRVNNYEECGFGQVTTDFGLNYLRDEYVQSQVDKEGITSQSECISGTSSIYNLLNLNAQAGAENAIDPAIYEKNIIRVCSTTNPGEGSDNLIKTEDQKWVEVGYCDDKEIKCWIDKSSIGDAFIFESNKDESVKKLTERVVKQIESQEGYLDENQFKTFMKNLTKKSDEEKIISIGDVFDKLFRSNWRAHVLFLRGNAYGGLSKNLMFEFLNNLKTKPGPAGITSYKPLPNNLGSYNSSNFFVFRLSSTDQISFSYVNYDGWYFRRFVEEDLQTPNRGGFLAAYDYGWENWKNVNSLENVYFEKEYEKKLISNLKSRDFENGLDKLLEQVFALDEGKFFSGKIVLEDRQISISGLSKIDEIFFRFNENTREWEWSFDEDEWIESPNIKSKVVGTNLLEDVVNIVAGFSSYGDVYQDETVKLDNPLQNLIKSLEGKSLVEGAREIFLYDKEKTPYFTNVNKNILNDYCKQYYELIRDKSIEKNIPTNLLLALIYTESNCKISANSGSSFGLMQINANVWCGKYSLPSDKEQCKKVLLEDVETNVNIGTEILSSYYKGEEDTIYFTGCNVENVEYSGWEAALRRYNGFKGDNKKTCNEKYPRQDYYVEEVLSRADKLIGVISGGEDFDFDKNSLSSLFEENLGETPDKVFSKLKEVMDSLVGKKADLREFCDSSGESESCYSAVMKVYEDAGFDYRDLKYKDYYSATEFEKIEGTNVFIKDETDKFVFGKRVFSESEKLDLLKPGYQFDAVISAPDSKKVGNSQWAAHAMIFVNWSDRSKNIATIFDWRGPGRTYQYSEMDLSNDKNFVYLIRKISALILKPTQNNNGFYTLETALKKAGDLIGKYGEFTDYSDELEFKDFIDEICSEKYEGKIFTKDDCNDIKGEGGWFNFEDNLGDVRDLLSEKIKSSKEGGDKNTLRVLKTPTNYVAGLAPSNQQMSPVSSLSLNLFSEEIFSSENVVELTPIWTSLNPNYVGGLSPGYSFYQCFSEDCESLSEDKGYSFSPKKESDSKLVLDMSNVQNYVGGLSPTYSFSFKKEVLTDENGEVNLEESSTPDTVIIKDSKGDPVSGQIVSVFGTGMPGSMGNPLVLKTDENGEVNLKKVVEEKESTKSLESISDLNQAIEISNSLIEKHGKTSHYSTNEEISLFIDSLCRGRILEEEECSDYKGEGWFNIEEGLGDLRNFLESKVLEDKILPKDSKEEDSNLIEIASKGSLSEVESLIKSSGNLIDLDSHGQNLLHYAARYNDFEVVKLIAENNPSLVGAQNKYGVLPRDLALKNEGGDSSQIANYLRAFELKQIVEGKRDLPSFDFCDWEGHYCSAYVNSLSWRLFARTYSKSDAWCREVNDPVVWKASSKDVSNNQKIESLIKQGTLTPGMMVGVYYPYSSTGLIGKEVSCGEKTVIVQYTHNLLYLGESNSGKKVFAELFYKGKPSIRFLENFDDEDAGFISMVVVKPRN